MFFVLFFHVVCKISNFIKWTAKHLVQASCTELTLSVTPKSKSKLVLNIKGLSKMQTEIECEALRNSQFMLAKADYRFSFHFLLLSCQTIEDLLYLRHYSLLLITNYPWKQPYIREKISRSFTNKKILQKVCWKTINHRLYWPEYGALFTKIVTVCALL